MLTRKNIIKVENYFEVFLIIFLLGLFLYLISNFLVSIFLAATMVFLVYTPYQKLSAKIQNKSLSAIFIMFLVFHLLFFSTFFIGSSLVKETSSLIYTGSDMIFNFNFDNCNYVFCDNIKDNVDVVKELIGSSISKIGTYLADSYLDIFSSISSLIINTFIFILAFYFFLVDGDKFMKYVKRIVPMKEEYKHALFLRFRDVSKAVFVDSLLVAIVQGSLIGLAFWFVGFDNFILWGTIGAFFSLIPIIGSTVIWVPAVLILLIKGMYVKAVVLALYCMIIVGLSDNVLRVLLLNKKTHIHPFLVLLAVLGGLEIFGFVGIFIGPIIISLLITVVQLYKLDLNEW